MPIWCCCILQQETYPVYPAVYWGPGVWGSAVASVVFTGEANAHFSLSGFGRYGISGSDTWKVLL